MPIQALLKSVSYIVNSEGEKTAVVVDIQHWQQLLDHLNHASQQSTHPMRGATAEETLKFAGLIPQNDLGLMREVIEDEFGIDSSRHSDE